MLTIVLKEIIFMMYSNIPLKKAFLRPFQHKEILFILH